MQVNKYWGFFYSKQSEMFFKKQNKIILLCLFNSNWLKEWNTLKESKYITLVLFSGLLYLF